MMLVVFTKPLTPADYLDAARHPAKVQKSPSACKDVQRQLHAKMTSGLQSCADDLSASLHYSQHCYAQSTIIENGCKLTGWPVDVPFVSFGTIPGGIDAMSALLKAWDKGEIKFEPATLQDILNAMRDPATVHPNYRPPRDGVQEPSAWTLVSDLRSPIIVPCLVLNAETLEDVGIDLTSTDPSAVAAMLGEVPHRQRSDVKKPRQRNLTGPYSRPHPFPKEGVKSEPFVLESAAQDYHPDSMPEHGHWWAVHDPLPQFFPVMPWYAPTFDFVPIPSTSYGGAGQALFEMAMPVDVFGTMEGWQYAGTF